VTAQALASGVERPDLGVHPRPTSLATRGSRHHAFAPMRGTASCNRDRAINGTVRLATGAVGLADGPRVDEGTRGGRVGSAIEGLAPRREQTPLRPTGRGADHGLDRTPRRGAMCTRCCAEV
jgi:hypothetical protein